MPVLIHQFIERQASNAGKAIALRYKSDEFSYAQLYEGVLSVAHGLIENGLLAGERVAIYLPKTPEAVFTIFGTSAAGGAFVPINPLLKPQQVKYILNDCNVRILVTSTDRLTLLADILPECKDLQIVVVTDNGKAKQENKMTGVGILDWSQLLSYSAINDVNRRIDSDMVAILYTSGSTGNPKGVILSHKNMMAGAKSVVSYLGNTPKDSLLALLPFSFDYGLSQLTTAFCAGASVVLMDYLLPRDVIKAVTKYQITGLAAVPPLWNQLAQLEWPAEAAQSLRYITNSGSAMPIATTSSLKATLPKTEIFLMYGLTEAFRSTFLPPEQVGIRPESIGKAIPNAEILVVREDGSECSVDEPGELVHRGALVTMGYWNDPEKTAERFKPAPIQMAGIPLSDTAVWSGDFVRRDEEGYLYFISRKDEMIKTSGYRVSPTEVEQIISSSGLVTEAVALGITHPSLGQAIALIIADSDASVALDNNIKDDIIAHCRRELPNYMVPQVVISESVLPRNQNGKIDRKILADKYRNIFDPGIQ